MLELKKETTSDYLELLDLYLPKMATSEDIEAWILDHFPKVVEWLKQ